MAVVEHEGDQETACLSVDDVQESEPWVWCRLVPIGSEAHRWIPAAKPTLMCSRRRSQMATHPPQRRPRLGLRPYERHR